MGSWGFSWLSWSWRHFWRWRRVWRWMMIAGLVQQPSRALEEAHGIPTREHFFARIPVHELSESCPGAVQSCGDERRPFGRIRQRWVSFIHLNSVIDFQRISHFEHQDRVTRYHGIFLETQKKKPKKKILASDNRLMFLELKQQLIIF